MQRSKRILLVAHCIFNQNTVIAKEARAEGAMKSAADWAIGEGFGIVQLPCPEFSFLGLNRLPMTYEEYNNAEYRKHCREILKPILKQVEEFSRNGYEISGLLGIQGSPSCDLRAGRGVFMEELLAMTSEKKIHLTKLWYFPNNSETDFNGDVHTL